MLSYCLAWRKHWHVCHDDGVHTMCEAAWLYVDELLKIRR